MGVKPPEMFHLRKALHEKCPYLEFGPYFPAFGLNTERYGVSASEIFVSPNFGSFICKCTCVIFAISNTVGCISV